MEVWRLPWKPPLCAWHWFVINEFIVTNDKIVIFQVINFLLSLIKLVLQKKPYFVHFLVPGCFSFSESVEYNQYSLVLALEDSLSHVPLPNA